jgi:TRAP-type mannitol/chloroaromatic compound transport system permease small subunit
VQGLLFTIDRISTWVGKTFAWCIVALTLVASYEIFVRKLFRAPTEWAFDASWMLYGTLFMMAGAYALARNAHVRGDFLYRAWRPRRQAAMDLVLYILFFFPGMIAFVYVGYSEAAYSLSIKEKSMFSPFGLIIWPVKMLIPIAGALMVLQGIAEVLRCIMCLRSGQWPPRLHDAEETEKLILEEAERKRRAEAGKPA